MGTSPGAAITIPDDEVIRDEDVQRDQQPAASHPPQTWLGRAADSLLGPPKPHSIVDMARGGSPPSFSDVVSGVKQFGKDFVRSIGDPISLGAGAALGGFPRSPEILIPKPLPTGGEGLPETTGGVKPSPLFERDATRQNVPFAGEERTVPIERDATALNKVPFAGEEIPEPPVRTSPFGAGATSSLNPPPSSGSIGTPIARNEPTPPISFVSKFEKPAAVPVGRIIQPGTPAAEPLHVEGSYWSFKEPALRRAVLSGDRDAAFVYKERFGDLPPNARYLTDVGDRPNRGLYRSRNQ